MRLVASLDTRPGRRFSNERTHYVEPDVHIVKVGDDYVIQLNDNGLPRLRISRAYHRMLQAMKRRGSEAEARQYIKEKMRSAVWLIKSLDIRNDTLIRVAKTIVDRQQDFFEQGEESMKPMILRDVAEVIGMHESTISRATTGKYMHTPRGVFEFRFFFSSHVEGEDGDGVSSTAIRARIRRLISDEEPKRPLSDNAISTILADEGIQVARRTVAKYRESMGFPSSSERRRVAAR